MATGFDTTGFDTTLGSIVKEALGPQLRVCQDTVLLDLERARMTAEDLRGAAIEWKEMASTTSHRMEIAENMIGEARAATREATEAARVGTRGGTRDALRIALINLDVSLKRARWALHDDDSESEESSEEEMRHEEEAS